MITAPQIETAETILVVLVVLVEEQTKGRHHYIRTNQYSTVASQQHIK
jgi:hypothetical protein